MDVNVEVPLSLAIYTFGCTINEAQSKNVQIEVKYKHAHNFSGSNNKADRHIRGKSTRKLQNMNEKVGKVMKTCNKTGTKQ